jgi:uncharacterized membrane protein YfcA
MTFPVSGVAVSPLVPVAVAYVVSLVTSTCGVSGAFVLLPFQVSVLGFTGPAVTATNHVFNVVATPSGIGRYVREKRMVWPLAAVIAVGTVPGVIAGSLVRIYLLPDPRHFKIFMGLVLLLIGGRLLATVVSGVGGPVAAARGPLEVDIARFDWRRIEYGFQGSRHGISTPALAALAAAIGVIGGAYGVGGGAIIAPLLVSLFRLPVHTIAGATLLGTCLTSFVAITFFQTLGSVLGGGNASPDWALGLLFGMGGLLGTYTGARLQGLLPARLIEAVLAVAVTGLALSYLL